MKRLVVSGLTACVCVMAWGCDKGAEQPDPQAVEGGAQESSPEEAAPEAKASEGVLLEDETKAELDTYWAAEVGYDSFVPIYVSERGVAVDGADGVRYAPGTTRPADADMDGALIIKSLMPALNAASKARAMSAEEMKSMKQLGLGIFVEPHVPYASFSSLVYTTAIGLRPTPADDAESDRFVIFGGGQILKLMVRRAGTSDWDGYNATVQGLSVGPDSEAREAEAKKTQPSVRIDSRGIWVSLDDAPMSPVEGCPVGGPSLCNEEVADATELIAKVRSLEGAERQAALGELVALYDLRGLHDVLVSMKAKTPDETIARLSAGEDVPMAVVSAVAAATRTRRIGKDGASAFDGDDAAFDAARSGLERPNHQGDALFPDLIFGM